PYTEDDEGKALGLTLGMMKREGPKPCAVGQYSEQAFIRNKSKHCAELASDWTVLHMVKEEKVVQGETGMPQSQQKLEPGDGESLLLFYLSFNSLQNFNNAKLKATI
ncbi:hypothetical protein HispidOSU_021900, partial [Sigmodon hispidus]